MDKRDVFPLLMIVAFGVVVGGLCIVANRHSAREAFEKEAVSAGAARYVFDDAGDPHFEWRKP